MTSVEQWRVHELVFIGLGTNAGHREVDVVFSGPGTASLRRPAFWDGGSTWRVRVALPAPGEWTFRTTSTDERDTGLQGRTGTIVCEPPSAAAGVYRHGFLRAAASGTHLEHQDGRPFFWLGDTHWRFAWESWDRSNAPGWSSQFRDTVDLRVRQGFSVYQSNILSWSPPEFWDRLVADDELDPAFFRDVLDPRFRYIADSGLIHAVGLGWYAAVDERPAAVVRFAREIVARYGAYPVVWTLGGEVAGYDPELRADRLAAWRDVAEEIRARDAYRHPITAHLTNERPLPADLQDEEWLTFALSQLGHGDKPLDPAHWRDHLAAHPGKPLVEGESLYEGLTSVEPAGRRTVTDTMVRQVAYRAIQSGCCGYTYGGQGVWNGAWDESDSRSMWGSLPWYDGLSLPGAAQMGHLRRFYESIPWSTLRPAPELFDTNFWTNEYFYHPLVSADPALTTVVAYFGETYRHDEGDAWITGLSVAEYAVDWFDPREGEQIPVLHSAIAEGGRIAVPKPPTAGDWLLLVRAHM